MATAKDYFLIYEFIDDFFDQVINNLFNEMSENSDRMVATALGINSFSDISNNPII